MFAQKRQIWNGRSSSFVQMDPQPDCTLFWKYHTKFLEIIHFASIVKTALCLESEFPSLPSCNLYLLGLVKNFQSWRAFSMHTALIEQILLLLIPSSQQCLQQISAHSCCASLVKQSTEIWKASSVTTYPSLCTWYHLKEVTFDQGKGQVTWWIQKFRS